MSQGLNIGKWSTRKHCDGVAVVKNVKFIMCQEGDTLPFKGGLFPLTDFYSCSWFNIYFHCMLDPAGAFI